MGVVYLATMSSTICDSTERPRMYGSFPTEDDLLMLKWNLELNKTFLDLGLDLRVVPGLTGPIIKVGVVNTIVITQKSALSTPDMYTPVRILPLK